MQLLGGKIAATNLGMFEHFLFVLTEDSNFCLEINFLRHVSETEYNVWQNVSAIGGTVSQLNFIYLSKIKYRPTCKLV